LGELQKTRTTSGFGKSLRVVEVLVPSEVPHLTPRAAVGIAYEVVVDVAALGVVEVAAVFDVVVEDAVVAVAACLWWCFFFGTAALLAVTRRGISRGTMNRDRGASLRSRAEDIRNLFCRGTRCPALVHRTPVVSCGEVVVLSWPPSRPPRDGT
jgi:hypothetical protein